VTDFNLNIEPDLNDISLVVEKVIIFSPSLERFSIAPE